MSSKEHIEQCKSQLDGWLDGLEMPPLDHPRRRLEELCLGQLRNFFLLLLARFCDDIPATPLQAMARIGEPSNLDPYQTHLTLPLSGTPDTLVSAIDLGNPSGALFALQTRLAHELNDQGRELILGLGRLF